MGLDMYLTKKYYVKNWEHTVPENKYEITVLKGGKPSTIPTDKITYITTEAMYWNQANAIHKWFVDNVQDGNDDCGYYYVDSDKLKELLALCTKVLNSTALIKGKIVIGYRMEDGELMEDSSLAEELLPSTSGFFFGGTDYDEYYYHKLQYTKTELEKLLAIDDGGGYEYHSSW